jgi:hypothetical protein
MLEHLSHNIAARTALPMDQDRHPLPVDAAVSLWCHVETAYESRAEGHWEAGKHVVPL